MNNMLDRTLETLITQEEIAKADQQTPILPPLQEIKEGKIDPYSLPYSDRITLEKQYYDNLPDEEAKAAWRKGWRDKPFWKGKAKDGSDKEFVDYREYNRIAQEYAPVQRERYNQVNKENDDLKRELEELRKSMNQVLEINKVREDRDFKQYNLTLDAQLQEARENGDVNRLENLLKQKMELESAKYQFKEEQPNNQQSQFQSSYQAPQQQINLNPYEQKVLSEWVSENPWFNEDPQMRAMALNYANQIMSNGQHLNTPFEFNLQKVRDHVATVYPHKLRANKPIHVESANSGFGGGQERKKGWIDLPDSVKKTYASAKATGKTKLNASEYAERYFANLQQ
jgi:hypothetical protein